jgi:DNA-3-methyladenine glycosylase II
LSTTSSHPIVATVSVAAPFDFDLTVSAHGRFSQEAVNRYMPGQFRRAFWLKGRPVVAELRPGSLPGEAPQTAILTITGENIGPTEAEHLVERISFMFGLQENQAAFHAHIAGDRVLSKLVERYRGLHPIRWPSLYELLVGAIIAQQITLSFAATVKQRFVHRYGRAVLFGNETLWTFPTPEALGNATIEDLMALQFSRRKAEYLLDLSRAIASGSIDERALQGQPDADVIETLMRQRGLGLWSAQWALIRALGRPDAVPADDIGVRRAVGIFYQVTEGASSKASAAQVAAVAEDWRPYRSLATHYLLTALRLLDRPT